MKTCVYVRCIEESHFLNAFIEHYINLGFDMIYVLYQDTQNTNYKLPNQYQNNVTIEQVQNSGNLMLDRYKDIIDTDTYKWILNVDLDEFLILNTIFLNINDVIQFYVEMNKKVNVIQFGWLWAHKFSTSAESVEQILSTRKLLIGKQENSTKIWYKSMIKSKYLQKMGTHISMFKEGKTYTVGYNKKIIRVASRNQPNDMNTWISWTDTNNLRNHSIDSNTYKDGFLLHISTRNICDAFAKAQAPAAQVDKKTEDLIYIKNIFENQNFRKSLDDDDYLISLVKKVGYRLRSPLCSLHFGKLNNNKVLGQINKPLSRLPICMENSMYKKTELFALNMLADRLDKYFIA